MQQKLKGLEGIGMGLAVSRIECQQQSYNRGEGLTSS